MEIIYKSNWNAMQRGLGLKDRESKSERRWERFNWEWNIEVVIEVNINNQSKSLLHTNMSMVLCLYGSLDVCGRNGRNLEDVNFYWSWPRGKGSHKVVKQWEKNKWKWEWRKGERVDGDGVEMRERGRERGSSNVVKRC